MAPAADGEACPTGVVLYVLVHSTVLPVNLSIQHVSFVVVEDIADVDVSVCMYLNVLNVPNGMVVDSIAWLLLVTDRPTVLGVPFGWVAQDSVALELYASPTTAVCGGPLRYAGA